MLFYNKIIALIAFASLLSCSNGDHKYNSPNEKHVNVSTAIWEVRKIRELESLSLRKCGRNCNKKVTEAMDGVSKYFKLNGDVFLLSSDRYYALSMPTGNVIMSEKFLAHSKNEIMALLCHEMSHASYGHGYEKHFLSLVRKYREEPVSFGIKYKKNLGVGELIKHKAQDIDKWLLASLVYSVGGVIDGDFDGSYLKDEGSLAKKVEDLTYLGEKIYPLNFEIQADSDSIRCLRYNNIPPSESISLISKVFDFEKNKLSEEEKNRFDVRVLSLKRKLDEK